MSHPTVSSSWPGVLLGLRSYCPVPWFLIISFSPFREGKGQAARLLAKSWVGFPLCALSRPLWRENTCVFLLSRVGAPCRLRRCFLSVAALRQSRCRFAFVDSVRLVVYPPCCVRRDGHPPIHPSATHDRCCVFYILHSQIGFEVAQSNAAWLLEAGHCGGGPINGTRVGCEKRCVGGSVSSSSLSAVRRVVHSCVH